MSTTYLNAETDEISALLIANLWYFYRCPPVLHNLLLLFHFIQLYSKRFSLIINHLYIQRPFYANGLLQILSLLKILTLTWICHTLQLMRQMWRYPIQYTSTVKGLIKVCLSTLFRKRIVANNSRSRAQMEVQNAGRIYSHSLKANLCNILAPPPHLCANMGILDSSLFYIHTFIR